MGSWRPLPTVSATGPDLPFPRPSVTAPCCSSVSVAISTLGSVYPSPCKGRHYVDLSDPVKPGDYRLAPTDESTLSAGQTYRAHAKVKVWHPGSVLITAASVPAACLLDQPDLGESRAMGALALPSRPTRCVAGRPLRVITAIALDSDQPWKALRECVQD